MQLPIGYRISSEADAFEYRKEPSLTDEDCLVENMLRCYFKKKKENVSFINRLVEYE
jgi:hypothetical protein